MAEKTTKSTAKKKQYKTEIHRQTPVRYHRSRHHGTAE